MMSVTSPEPRKWEITTPKGRKITVEAPHITETEAKIIATLTDTITDRIESKIEELMQQYDIEVTIDITTGKGVGRFRKKLSTPPA
jgi:hypothetical protein